MGKVVNLRQFKKRKTRADKQAQADTNRKLHGVSTKLRKQAAASNIKRETSLAGKKLTPKTDG